MPRCRMRGLQLLHRTRNVRWNFPEFPFLGDSCRMGGLQIPRWLGSDALSAWWLVLAPATLEFWVQFPNERNQGKQALYWRSQGEKKCSDCQRIVAHRWRRCAAIRRGASMSWGCDRHPFCCTWLLDPNLSWAMRFPGPQLPGAACAGEVGCLPNP